MFRRTILLSLAGLAVLFLVWTGVTSRDPVETPASVGEIVKASKPTATRVLFPEELEVIESSMQLAQTKDSVGVTARHDLVIRNEGKVKYRNTLLEFSYLGPGRRVLERKTRLIAEPLLPDATLSIHALEVTEPIPEKTTASTVRILYSDIDSD